MTADRRAPDSPAAGFPPDRRQELHDQLLAEQFAPVPRKPPPRERRDGPHTQAARRRTLANPPEQEKIP